MSRQEGCRPHVVDGVRNCVGKVQVVNRYPWVLAVFIPTQQCPSTTAAAPCCRVGTPRGRLVSRTGSTPSYLDSTDSGASQQGWSGTSIRADSQDWSGTYIRADSQGWLGTCIRADGQGWSRTCTRADGQQHRPSSTFSNALRRPPTLSDALRLQRSPCLPHLSCLVCRHISSKDMFLQHFELTFTTARCSVHMPKHPSEEAGPSDRCAMPS